ncbi:gliding motility-associated ABC transporter substrate-binding protein GldG [Marinilabilia salmonicolor]|uniref:Gliding-associated putative ABC transporter substrate-binding component GldG n=1 Tax=Marinilabilia salmonicolor TaxID=989 RepID=A0A368UNM8_9BACT|nr:gliding motility-associated ABC transporter substrate-binding protein GldG [Marinilabilia salmonicolor]RCW30389.1 gliding-associated putative ABC transporter substrate-binding component GldG [Marinilabilia salmonicolor]
MFGKSNKQKDLIHFGLLLALVVLVNLLASSVVLRLDLTEEKRFTLADITTDFLSEMDQPVFASVYLSGDLNVGFSRLSQSVEDKLDEFGVYAGSNLDYRFIDPNDSSDESKRATEQFKELGLEPVPVYEAKEDGSRSRSLVYPYLILQSGDTEIAVNLLENMPGQSGAENLNASVEALEFKLIDAARRLLIDEMPRIAFLEGHGEYDEIDVVDITDALSRYYQVDRGNPGNSPEMLAPYEALIIAGPKKEFAEDEKYAIDQYIMHGGRVLWLIDALGVTMDSLQHSMQTVGLPMDINLDDQLFRYGFRINPVLVQDVQSGMIPVNVAPAGQSSQFVPMPWTYSPLLNTNSGHPVTRNVNVVRGEFVSSIDTVGGDLNTTKTPLLRTSRYSREMEVPVYISLAQVEEQPARENFPQSHIPVAYLSEGAFTSAFLNRPVPPGVNGAGLERRDRSVPTRMIVVADGEIIRNEVHRRESANPGIVPLGYDEVTRQTFGNKQFILNAVNYLTDEEGWMNLRTRNYRLRLLDRDKVANEAGFWKAINMGIPVLFVLLAGLLVPLWRKRRYGKE